MAGVFIAHLPAGYIASKLLYRRCDPLEISCPAFMLAGMLGAIAPDFDLAWFYLVDDRQHNHHSYFTHYPVFWLALLAVSCAWYGEAERRANAALWCNFALNGLIHMVLDSVVGGIRWLAPLHDEFYSLATVAAIYQPWWLNFLLHWSMLFEGAIILLALYVWRGPARQWRLR